MKIEKENIDFDKIVDLLKKSEDDGTFLDSLYDLYFFIGITKGIDDIRNGRGISLDDFLKEREAIYESCNRRFGWTLSK